MRVVVNKTHCLNIDDEQLIQVTCDYCGSVLEITSKDVHYGQFGCAMITCPCCEKETFAEGFSDLVLTPDNLVFPDHFSHCIAGDLDGTVDCFDGNLVPEIRKSITYLRNHKDANYYGGHIVGNLMLYVVRNKYDESYEVIASKDFYSTIIPFEQGKDESF